MPSAEFDPRFPQLSVFALVYALNRGNRDRLIFIVTVIISPKSTNLHVSVMETHSSLFVGGVEMML
jgi:hypothetical protein